MTENFLRKRGDSIGGRARATSRLGTRRRYRPALSADWNVHTRQLPNGTERRASPVLTEVRKWIMNAIFLDAVDNALVKRYCLCSKPPHIVMALILEAL